MTDHTINHSSLTVRVESICDLFLVDVYNFTVSRASTSKVQMNNMNDNKTNSTKWQGSEDSFSVCHSEAVKTVWANCKRGQIWENVGLYKATECGYRQLNPN